MVDIPRELPAEVLDAFKVWRRQTRILQFFHVTLLLIAAIGSILAASAILKESWKPACSLAAAIAVAVMAAVDLGGKANGFRNAWRLMNAAIVRFKNRPEFSIEDLVAAYEAAERLIGDLPAGPRPAVIKDVAPEVRDAERHGKPSA